MGSAGLTLSPPPPTPQTAQGRGLGGVCRRREAEERSRYLLMERRQRLRGGPGRLAPGARARRARSQGRLSPGGPRRRPQGRGAPVCARGTGGHSHVAVRTPDKEGPFKVTGGGHSGRPDVEGPRPPQDTGAGGSPCPGLTPSCQTPDPEGQTGRPDLGWGPGSAGLIPSQTLGASVTPFCAVRGQTWIPRASWPTHHPTSSPRPGGHSTRSVGRGDACKPPSSYFLGS